MPRSDRAVGQWKVAETSRLWTWRLLVMLSWRGDRPGGTGKTVSGLRTRSRAVSGAIRPSLSSSTMAWSSVCIPSPRPVCIAEGIWKVLPSRMRFPIAGVQIMISSAAIRPGLIHGAEEGLSDDGGQ